MCIRDRAQADLTRAKELAGKQIISMAQLDGAQATFDAATANLEATQRQVLAATGSIANAQAGVRLAQARLAAAEAARDNAALQLSYATVEAPLSGIVSRKQVELGQLIQAGQAMMSIVADTGLFVTANMKETQLARLRVGQKVDLEILSLIHIEMCIRDSLQTDQSVSNSRDHRDSCSRLAFHAPTSAGRATTTDHRRRLSRVW